MIRYLQAATQITYKSDNDNYMDRRLLLSEQGGHNKFYGKLM